MRDSKIVIKTTRLYDIFNVQKGNRPVLDSDVKKVEDKILSENLLAYHPILVGPDMEVIDGQHRLEVARRAGLEISFIMMDKVRGLKTTQVVNTTGKPWRSMDFLNSYCELKNENYIRFKEVLEEYDFLSISLLINFSCNFSVDSPKEVFEGGRLDIFRVERLISSFERIKKYSDVPQIYKNRVFHQFIICAGRKGIEFKDSRLISRIKKNERQFDYIPRNVCVLGDIISTVYNFNLSQNIVNFNLRDVK